MKISEEKYQEITDYISDELEPSQKERFEAWSNASEENQKVYQQILKKVLFTRWSLKSQQINTKVELHKFRSRIDGRKKFLPFLAVAASIIIILGITAPLLMNTLKDQGKENISELNVIEPGKKGALLTLSTGKQVNIEENDNSIREIDGSTIKIDSKIGLQYSKPETDNLEVIYNELSVDRGYEYNILLADGTRVWLNSESELRYPVNFVGDTRMVFAEGEVYFDVAPDKEKPFVVNTWGQQVIAYGTEFCVNAYDANSIKTVLVEGSVGIKANNKSSEVMLQPGELGETNIQTGDVRVKKVNVRPYVAWKDGEFAFDDENLENVLNQFSRWYDVEVFFMNERAKNIRYTCDMKRYSQISELLYFFEETSDVKFEINERSIVVMAK